MDTRKIDPGDLAYHVEVLMAAQRQQAVTEHWIAHLGRKYRLEQGDRVELDGTIVRRPAPPEVGLDGRTAPVLSGAEGQSSTRS